jgi:hypothetical protein
MAKLLIGTALSAALLASAACSGTSPSGPSASLSPASPSSTFSSQALSATGVQSGTSSSSYSGGSRSDSGHSDSGHSDSGPSDDERRGPEAEIEGAIVSIGAQSLVVRTTTVKVSASTVIRHGHTPVAFADLKVGEQIHVKGTSDGKTIAATEITVQNEDDDHERTVEAQGVVSGLKGKCPSITFTIGTTNIATSATTTFRHGACEHVTNGGSVEVTGARQADGSILASQVSIAGRDEERDADSD